jgi:hypothetical protein
MYKVFIFLSLVAVVLTQITVDHNHQTISDLIIQANESCATPFFISPISSSAYMTIAVEWVPSNQYPDTSELMILASSNSNFNDALSKISSQQVGPQIEVLLVDLQPLTGSSLYVEVCRISTAPTNDNRTFAITFGFSCDGTSYPYGTPFACAACPTNSTRSIMSSDTTIASCECNEGTYKIQTDANNPTSFQCLTCPFGAICNGGENQPFPMDGYYPLNNKDEMIYVKCPFPNACLHSQKNGSQFDIKVPNIDIGNLPIYIPPISINVLLNLSKTNYTLTVNELCTQGYSGYLCGECKEGFYRLGTRCLSCGSNYSTNNFLIAVYVFYLLLIFGLNVPMTIMNTHVSSFGILLNFIQISALFSMFNLKWSDGLLTFFDVLSLANINIQLFRPECITPVNYFAEFMVIIFVPAMYVATSLIPLFLWLICCKFIRQPLFTRDRFLNYIQWTINSWLSVVIIQGYVALSSWTLSYYSCDSYGKLLTNYNPGDVNRIPKHLWNTDQLCSTDDYYFAAYLIFFYISLGVYVLGIPFVGLISWYVIVCTSRWRARKRLVQNIKQDDDEAHKLYGELGLTPTEIPSSEKPTFVPEPPATTSPELALNSPDAKSENELVEKSRIERLARELKNSTTSLLVEGRYALSPVVVGIEAHSGTVRTFGVLYQRYRPRRFWWEILIVLRKLLIVICFSYLEQQPVIAVVVSSFVILAALVLQLYFQPYRKYTSNILEMFLLAFQYIMLILSLMFYASQEYDGIPIVGSSSAVTNTVIVFITLGISLGVVAFALEALYEFRRTLYVPIREKIREQAFKNRAEHALKVIKKRNTSPDVISDENIEVDDMDQHDDNVIVADDGMNIIPQIIEVETGSSNAKEIVTAVYKYEAQNDDELTIQEGDRFVVLQRNDDGWIVAQREGTQIQGLIPGNYVQ